MKKLLSLMLTLVMVLSMCVAAFAATPYSITILNHPDATHVSINGRSYTAYKLFNMTTADETFAEGYDTPVAYTVERAFENFTYLEKGGKDLINYVSGLTNSSEEINAFGEAVKAYIDENNVTGITVNAANEKAEFLNLEAGYYLVYGDALATEAGSTADDTVVVACTLQSTDPASVIVLKAGIPTVDKVIVKDGGEYKGTSEDYKGDTIEFKITTVVPNCQGYDSYVFRIHDQVSKGLSINSDSVKVTINGIEQTESPDLELGDYVSSVIPATETEGEKLIIQFNDISKFTTNEKVVITYSAELDGENVLVTDKETNRVYVEYSNNPYVESETGKTPEDIVYVYDFSIVIDKVATDNEDNKLEGAQFVLRKKGENSYYQYNMNNSNETRWVALDSALETYFDNGNIIPLNNSATVVETDENGKASFAGLEAGTYELVEVVAPDGYNLLEDPIEVVITAEYNEDGTLKSSSATSTNGGQYEQTVQVKNTSGTLLPETGGIGTVIFYLIGGVLVLGSVVLLVTKKRMNASK